MHRKHAMHGCMHSIHSALRLRASRRNRRRVSFSTSKQPFRRLWFQAVLADTPAKELSIASKLVPFCRIRVLMHFKPNSETCSGEFGSLMFFKKSQQHEATGFFGSIALKRSGYLTFARHNSASCRFTLRPIRPRFRDLSNHFDFMGRSTWLSPLTTVTLNPLVANSR